jgi:CxxC-x17-CxxC domain-containing protein
MKDIMDNKKILIMNLAKGRIGEDYSALLGAMLITKIQLAAMGRVDIPEEERKDFYLYVDEFQNFATESFADILSEARKYKLNLIVAHQYIGQLEEKVRDAVFGNVGTIVSFRVGASDAEFLEKEFEPVFNMNDLVNLAKYDIYLKLMIDGVAGDAFSATSLPPMKMPERKSNLEKIIRVSRERYANKREVVESKISKWSGMDSSKQVKEPVIQGENSRKTDREKKNKVEDEKGGEEQSMWDSVCEMCGEKIKVPFKPDPERETYCRSCLVELRRQISRSMRGRKRNGEEGSSDSVEFEPEGVFQ